MRLFLIFLAIYSLKAFAIKDILTPCERKLVVDAANEIQLSANQIALDGALAIYMEQGMMDATGYLVADDFVRKNLSPSGQDFVRWLQFGDRVFIFDKNGGVKKSGYFGGRQEVKQVRMENMTFPVLSNFTYLFEDKELTKPVTAQGEMDDYFRKHNRAIVVQTLNDGEIAKLQERLKPFFDRYEAHQTNPDRIVRVGRSRAYQLAPFQKGVTGSASVKSERQISMMLNWETGEPYPGDPYWVFSYSMMATEKVPPLVPGDYLMLLDENGRVIEEGVISSKAFPVWADTEEKAKAIEAKFKAAHSAFLAKNIVSKPKSEPPKP